ncbi:hypothetical protein EXS73_01965 [Candidatus Pacearchaeota archaeon]|nr:hypothetical protein [Candidatus Pacearchaeota archaeon]
METSWKAKQKWMRRVLGEVHPGSLSPLVQAEDARTLARVSQLLSRGYTLTGSHEKATHQRALVTELYAEAGDRYAQARYPEDAARMYRAAGLEDKAEAVERAAETSLRRLRRDVLGRSTLVFIGMFVLVGLFSVAPSALGNVIAPVSSSPSLFLLFVCTLLLLSVAWLERRTLFLWWCGFTAIFK